MSAIPPVGPITDESELKRMAEIVAAALQFPADRAMSYYDAVGRENVRVVRVGGEVAGGLAQIPMGQFFGGRSIPMVGIAAVGIAPHHRSHGAASRLLKATLAELHERGVALSALYPATQPVYRRLGYEASGSQFEITLQTREIDTRDRELDVRPIAADDEPAIRRLYEVWAAQHPGNVDRNEFMWSRVRMLRGDAYAGYAVDRDGLIEGYVYYRQSDGDPFPHVLRATDIVAATPAAGRRLLALLADHRSMAATAVWNSGPNDPLLALLAEQPYKLTSRLFWMLRIVDVRAALAARGYSAHINSELHLRVRDAALPANSGDFVLRVREGRATTERGGSGRLEIDIRGLAALYSGHRSPAQLAAIGELSGPPPELAAAESTFAGPSPWMRDGF
jgi:predicted acetyltransferase